ncbi:Emopamil-binding protein [Aspergillus aurantiobrunneus]
MSSSTAPFELDTPTTLCVAFALSFMPIAYLLGTFLIPSTQTRNRLLFYWHAYDALTHLFIEGSFLYECFTSYAILPSGFTIEPAFLGFKDRAYGAAYGGAAPSARLWQEYAKADRRWATADATVVSLELLTVFLGGPAAVYVCYLLWASSRESKSSASASTQGKGAAKGTLWLVATALATAELYGGFMTFAPEWLTGSPGLETGNAVYLWFYLVFFNTLWVWIPLWVLWEAGKEVRSAFVAAEGVDGKRKTK